MKHQPAPSLRSVLQHRTALRPRSDDCIRKKARIIELTMSNMPDKNAIQTEARRLRFSP